jgi:thioredoxin reductase
MRRGGGRREGHALDVVIAGGSAAGLFSGLLLARAGHPGREQLLMAQPLVGTLRYFSPVAMR